MREERAGSQRSFNFPYLPLSWILDFTGDFLNWVCIKALSCSGVLDFTGGFGLSRTLPFEKNSAPPATMLPGAPRFPPPKLQQDQNLFPFFFRTQICCHRQWVRSPLPHLSTPPGPPPACCCAFSDISCNSSTNCFLIRLNIANILASHFLNASLSCSTHQVPLATETRYLSMNHHVLCSLLTSFQLN
ncbi:hypothetical protein NC653_033142 [Populus alba x Populus x berolinensis]|uniref:Uncharacterized protein n=1 Tax=Populus alba x Populus x berolinensis TaxID=444605 RepID=A0AAD6LTB5_9ROSI|nr:hypothetical protein NC653_033142 [Populus alba x Populus x berolinensis]